MFNQIRRYRRGEEKIKNVQGCFIPDRLISTVELNWSCGSMHFKHHQIVGCRADGSHRINGLDWRDRYSTVPISGAREHWWLLTKTKGKDDCSPCFWYAYPLLFQKQVGKKPKLQGVNISCFGAYQLEEDECEIPKLTSSRNEKLQQIRNEKRVSEREGSRAATCSPLIEIYS